MIKTSKKVILYNFDEKNMTTFHSDCKTLREDEILETKSLPEWSQLKNLVSAFQFFNCFWCADKIPNPKCVIVGAAPGNHLCVLAQAFPQFEYHLYDEAKFDPRLSSFKNIILHQKFFSDVEIEEWREIQLSQQNVFMIFDNRNPAFKKELSDKEKDKIFLQDLRFQEKCISAILPVKSLLKVCFPSNFNPITEKSEDKIHISFFDGIAYRHIYNDKNSKEFSLIPHDGVAMRLWNVPLIEDVIRYHNLYIRQQNYILPSFEFEDKMFISKEFNIKANYDGIMFFLTVKDVMKKFKPFCDSHRTPSLNEILKSCKKILNNILADGKNRLLPKSRS